MSGRRCWSCSRGLGLGLGAGLAIRAYLLRRYPRDRADRRPASRFEVMIAAGAAFIGYVAPLAFAMLGAWAVWPPPEFFPNGAVMAIVYGVIRRPRSSGSVPVGDRRRLCAGAPAWRAAPIGDAQAVRLAGRLQLVIALLGVHIAVDRATAPLSVVDSFSAVWNLLHVGRASRSR